MRIVKKEGVWKRKFAWLPVIILNESGQKTILLFEMYEEKSERCGPLRKTMRRLPNSTHEYTITTLVGMVIAPPPRP